MPVHWGFGSPLSPPSPSSASDTSSESLNQYLSDLVGDTLRTLEEAGCVELGGSGATALAAAASSVVAADDDGLVSPTAVGRIASFYYLDHSTMAVFARGLGPDLDVGMVLQVRACVGGISAEGL